MELAQEEQTSSTKNMATPPATRAVLPSERRGAWKEAELKVAPAFQRHVLEEAAKQQINQVIIYFGVLGDRAPLCQAPSKQEEGANPAPFTYSHWSSTFPPLLERAYFSFGFRSCKNKLKASAWGVGN